MNKLIATIGLVAALALTGCMPAIVTPPSEQDSDIASEQQVEEPASESGTRANPAPIGSTATDGDWAVTLNSVNLNAAEAVAAENQFNDPAPEGQVYILANITITYNGQDPDGSMPTLTADYVTVDGNSIDSYGAMVVYPDRIDTMGTLYEGASTTGNLGFLVPADTAAQGTLAITPRMFGDKVFFAVQ